VNHEDFVSGMAMLATTLPPRKPLEDAALEGYWVGLQGLTQEQFKRAVTLAIGTCKFMPAPVELRELVTPRRDLAHEGEIAWSAVRSAVDRIDYTVSEISFGPVVNACIRQLGGWDSLCVAKLTELDVWKKKEFLRLYELFASKSEIGDVGRMLEGPSDGQAHPPRVVSIAGIPSQPRREIEAPGAGEARRAIADHIRQLAETTEQT